jgi:hypothetical protein
MPYYNKKIVDHRDLVTSELILKFESRVDYHGPNGCHIWTGNTNSEEYGQVELPKVGGVPAHVLSYCIYTGDFDVLNHHVHHLCETHSCVNPDHLEKVPHEQHRSRHLARPRLSKEDVLLVQRHLTDGVLTVKEIAELLQVSIRTVQRINKKLTV